MSPSPWTSLADGPGGCGPTPASCFSSDTCDVDCVRERMKQKLQSAMRTLRKSINKQQFYIQFSGTEYEVAQKPSKGPEGVEACSTGQVHQDGKCGGCAAE